MRYLGDSVRSLGAVALHGVWVDVSFGASADVLDMIVTIVGSALFEEWYRIWGEELALAGHSVFGLPVGPARYADAYEEDRVQIAHVRRVQLHACDAVLLLNAFAYIGPATLRQVEIAQELRKPLYALESWGQGLGGVSWKNKPGYVVARRGYGIADGAASPIPTMDMRYAFDLLGPAGPGRQRALERLRGLKVKMGLPEELG